MEEEFRIYIGRFPGEIRTLLAQGKQVYKKALAKQRHGGTQDAQTAELRHGKTPRLPSCATAKKDKAKKAKEKKKQKEKKEKKTAKTGKNDTADAGDPTKTDDVQCNNAAANPSHEEVDWGTNDDEAELDSAPNAAKNLGECDSDNEDAPTTAPEVPVHLNGPWGEHGRPSDRASSSAGGARRPRTPSRSPCRASLCNLVLCGERYSKCRGTCGATDDREGDAQQ